MKKNISIISLVLLFNFSVSYADIIQPQFGKEYYFIPDGKPYVIRYGDSLTVRSINNFTCKFSTNYTKNIYMDVSNSDKDFNTVKYGAPLVMGAHYWVKQYGVPEYYFRATNDGCSVNDSTCNLTAGIDAGADVTVTCSP